MAVNFKDFNENQSRYADRYIGMTCLLKEYITLSDSLKIELKLVDPFSPKKNINSNKNRYIRKDLPFEVLTLSLKASSVVQQRELKTTLKNNLEKRIGVTFFSTTSRISNLAFPNQNYTLDEN